MQNNMVVHVCQMNFFYVFIVPGPILRHLGEFGKIRLLLGGKYTFFAEGGSIWVSKRRAMTDFQYFFLCRIWLHLILAWSRPMILNISGDIWILSDFRHLTTKMMFSIESKLSLKNTFMEIKDFFLRISKPYSY